MSARPRPAGGGTPYRCYGDPVPILRLDPQHIEEAAKVIAQAVRVQYQRLRRKSAGDLRHFLFIDPELHAYLVADIHAAADRWSRDRWPWMVGAYVPYAIDPERQLQRHRTNHLAIVERLSQDIGEHLERLSLLRP